MTKKTVEEQKHHLMDLLKNFREGMLVTKVDHKDLHGRPMHVAQVEEDGVIYFSASLNSPKVKEIERDSTAAVIFQDGKHFVSLSGDASVVRDRKKIDELWNESWKVWYPDGKNSPELGLIRVDPRNAEYWDVGGQNGFKYAFSAIKAYVTGTRPQIDDDENAKVDMSHAI